MQKTNIPKNNKALILVWQKFQKICKEKEMTRKTHLNNLAAQEISKFIAIEKLNACYKVRKLCVIILPVNDSRFRWVWSNIIELLYIFIRFADRI